MKSRTLSNEPAASRVDGSNRFLRNAVTLPLDYTASHARREYFYGNKLLAFINFGEIIKASYGAKYYLISATLVFTNAPSFLN
jgi:hypothetical protein